MSAFNLPALALSGVALSGAAILQSVYSTSPRRVILWNAEDSAGNALLDANGQPIVANLTPQVTLEERHYDAIRITEHPVEQGAAISDHAYKMPSQVAIRGGWSYAPNSAFPTILPKFTDSSRLSSLYKVLLQLQTNRILVSLVTGKRNYSNMMLETLAVHTDQHTENALLFVANFREVLLAQTHVVSVPAANVMKNPQLTGAVQDQGQTTLLSGAAINAPAANAILSGGASTGGPSIIGFN